MQKFAYVEAVALKALNNTRRRLHLRHIHEITGIVWYEPGEITYGKFGLHVYCPALRLGLLWKLGLNS